MLERKHIAEGCILVYLICTETRMRLHAFVPMPLKHIKYAR